MSASAITKSSGVVILMFSKLPSKSEIVLPALSATLASSVINRLIGNLSMAFLPGICEALGKRVGVPVVNPVIAALKTAEAVVSMQLAHSKAAWPVPKPQETV